MPEGVWPMLEPIDNKEGNEKAVKVDREILDSMMKAWLTPRTTGILNSPDSAESAEREKPESDQSNERKNNKFI